MPYDHTKETEALYATAFELRAEANRIREEAEHRARKLEAAAARQVQLGVHIHRLCTAGSAFECCRPPAGTPTACLVEDQDPHGSGRGWDREIA